MNSNTGCLQDTFEIRVKADLYAAKRLAGATPAGGEDYNGRDTR